MYHAGGRGGGGVYIYEVMGKLLEKHGNHLGGHISMVPVGVPHPHGSP